MLIPFGLDDARVTRFPRATVAILAACVLFQLLAEVAGGHLYGLALWSHGGLGQIGWLTATFVHFGWWHLLGNMAVFVLVCGPFVEDAWGPRFFAVFFVVAGVVSLAAQAAVFHDQRAAIAGASGAIAACLGAFAVRYARRKVRLLWTWGFLVARPTFQVSARLWILFGFSLDLLAAMEGTGGDVAVMSHVAGYLFGAGVALAARRWRLEDRLLRAEGGWSISEAVGRAVRLGRAGKHEEARARFARAVEARDAVEFAALELARLELAAGRPDAAAAAVTTVAGSPFVSRPALAAVLREVGPARLRPAVALRFAEDLEEYDRRLAVELADRGAEAGGRLGARALVLGVRLTLRGREPSAARDRAGRALEAPGLSPDLRRELEGMQREAMGRTELAWQA